MPLNAPIALDKADELIKFFHQEKFATRDMLSATQPGRGGFIFRGVNNAEFKNIPSAFRDTDNMRKLAHQGDGANYNNRKALIGKFCFEEAQRVHDFIESVDKLNIPSPIDYKMIPNIKAYYARHLGRKSIGDPNVFNVELEYPQWEYEEHFALAQHYGIPTRFLDWTESPLIAAWFAAYKVSSACRDFDRIHDIERIRVDFLSIKEAKQIGCKLVMVPRYRNQNLLRQEALFLNIRKANKLFFKNGCWPSLESLPRACESPSVSGSVTLPALEADSLLRILYDFKVKRETLFPSLENAASSIDYRVRLFSTRPV